MDKKKENSLKAKGHDFTFIERNKKMSMFFGKGPNISDVFGGISCDFPYNSVRRDELHLSVAVLVCHSILTSPVPDMGPV